jgi:hypothetical protein
MKFDETSLSFDDSNNGVQRTKFFAIIGVWLEESFMERKTLAPMIPLMALPLLLFVLFFVESRTGGVPPFSFQSLLGPYFGENPVPFIAIGAIGLAYPAVFVLFIFPIFARRAGAEMQVFAMTETPAIMGLLIGSLSHNPWAALPFFALSLGLYGFVFARASGQN